MNKRTAAMMGLFLAFSFTISSIAQAEESSTATHHKEARGHIKQAKRLRMIKERRHHKIKEMKKMHRIKKQKQSNAD